MMMLAGVGVGAVCAMHDEIDERRREDTAPVDGRSNGSGV